MWGCSVQSLPQSPDLTPPYTFVVSKSEPQMYVNVYFLILVITESVSIDKKAIFSQQTSLKTNNYVLPEWNGYCRRRD
jgi:hypothetical protein